MKRIRIPRNAFYDSVDYYHLRIRRLNSHIKQAADRLAQVDLPTSVTPDYTTLAQAIDCRSRYITDEFNNRADRRRWLRVFKPFSKPIDEETLYENVEMFKTTQTQLSLLVQRGLCKETIILSSSELEESIAAEKQQAS